MPRILIAGFQHETNTFAPTKADWAAFQSGAGYPAMSHGAAMLDRMGPTSLPMGGFIRDAAERGCKTLDGAPVTVIQTPAAKRPAPARSCKSSTFCVMCQNEPGQFFSNSTKA